MLFSITKSVKQVICRRFSLHDESYQSNWRRAMLYKLLNLTFSRITLTDVVKTNRAIANIFIHLETILHFHKTSSFALFIAQSLTWYYFDIMMQWCKWLHFRQHSKGKKCQETRHTPKHCFHRYNKPQVIRESIHADIFRSSHADIFRSSFSTRLFILSVLSLRMRIWSRMASNLALSTWYSAFFCTSAWMFTTKNTYGCLKFSHNCFCHLKIYF